MSVVYCSGNHSPEQLLKWLNKEFEIDFDTFSIPDFGSILNPLNKKKLKKNVILLSYRDYLRNAKVLNHKAYKNKNFFVFAPPFRCAEIGNSIWLDFENDKELLGISYRLTDWRKDKFSLSAQAEPIYRVDADFKTKVIDHIKSTGSILTPFMTLIYTLPSRASQKPVSYALSKWLFNNEPKSKLNSVFDRLRLDVSITQAKQDNFQKLLLGELGDKAREAFKLISDGRKAGKPVSYEDISKKVDIQAYDLRYISKVVQSGETYGKQEGISIRDFQKQQDAKRVKDKALVEEQRVKEQKDKNKVLVKKKAEPIGRKKIRRKKKANVIT
jgi:hypothetical protein